MTSVISVLLVQFLPYLLTPVPLIECFYLSLLFILKLTFLFCLLFGHSISAFLFTYLNPCSHGFEMLFILF